LARDSLAGLDSSEARTPSAPSLGARGGISPKIVKTS
jgi:hypothetical protein